MPRSKPISANCPGTVWFPTFLSGAVRITKREDLDPSGWETSGQLKLATHGLDDVSECAQVHVGSSFDLGNGALIDSKLLRQLHLRKVLRLSQFRQRQGLIFCVGPSFNALLRFRGHLPEQFVKFLRHRSTSSFSKRLLNQFFSF